MLPKNSPLRAVKRLAWSALIPAPRLSVSAWLDKHRTIPRGYQSPFPGPWRTSRTPYLREPLEAFVDPTVEILVLMFSSQVGKTEGLLGMMMYAFGVDAGPALWVMTRHEDSKQFSQDRITPSFRTCDAITVGSEGRTRSTDNSILHKRVNGFPFLMGGSNSPAGLASVPIRYLFCDEIDRWDASTPEGDAFELARQRTAAYRRRKIVICSTPGIKGGSRIEGWYEASDQRRLWCPCPRCGEFVLLQWAHVRWDAGAPESARIECPTCEGRIEDHERGRMIAAAEWRASAEGSRGVRGYHLWAIASPWTPLSTLIEEFLAKKADPVKLQTFVNLKLGESWEVPSEKIESANLLHRRRSYAQEVPAGARVLTAGVDTQDDRLEILVIGWGSGEESWVIHRETLFGDPAQADVWRELDVVLLRRWARESGGTTQVQCCLVDAGGHKTAAVYAAVVVRQHRRVYACFGKGGGANGRIVSDAKILETPQGNVARRIVDVDQAKMLIHARLRLPGEDGPGVVHFPLAEWCGDEFMTQLTSEHLITQKNKLGITHKVWAMRPGRSRNEVLDMFNYALGAYYIVCPSRARFDDLAARLDAASQSERTPTREQQAQPQSARPTNVRPTVKRSGYLGR